MKPPHALLRAVPACTSGRSHGEHILRRRPLAASSAARRTPHVSLRRGVIAQNAQSITVHFVEDDVMIEAEAGDSLLEVSYNAGCPIPTGCGCGSCGTCEVEMTVSGGAQQGKQVVRACNTMLPRGASGIAVSFLKDELWGDPGSVPPGAAINDDGYPPPPTTPDQQQ